MPAEHPLRAIRGMVDQALADLWLHLDALYARRGRPSIPPEQLLRALLLQALYAVRSERQLMEQIDFNLLFRWFVGLGMDEVAWDATVFTKNRDRLLQGEISQRLLLAVVEQARAQNLLSAEHFTVDGTLLEAWANRRSFEAKDPPPTKGTGARGKKLLRDTHESTTDREARLYKKSTAGESKPSYLGHVIIENRNGLVVAACATQSSTTAEREAALAMLDAMELGAATVVSSGKRMTLGADKLYQEEKFIAAPAPTPDRAARGGIRKAFAAVAELSDGGRTQRSGIGHQPEETQTGGEGVWLGQAGQHHAQDQVARAGAGRLVVSPVGDGQQSGTHGEAEKVNSRTVSAGSSVPAGCNEASTERKIRCRTAAQLGKNEHGEKLQQQQANFSAASEAVP